jgi:chromosome segregation ATPase
MKGSISRGAARSDHVALMTKAQNQIEQDIRVLLQLLSNSDEKAPACRTSKQSAPKIASKSSDNKQRALLKENQNLKKKIGDLTKQHSDIKAKADESQKKLQTQSNDFKQEKRKLLKRIKQEADRSKEKQQNLEQQIKSLQKFEDGKKRAESAVARERAAKTRSQDELQKCTNDLQSISSFLSKAVHPNVEVDRQLVTKALSIANIRACANSQPRAANKKVSGDTKANSSKSHSLQQRIAKKRAVLNR